MTGSYGFLGTHLKKYFEEECYLIRPSHKEFDLRRQDVCEWMMSKYNPDIIIHLAARVGGIGYNQVNPATLFYDNAIMGINLMQAAYENKVDKFVQLGTICAYPKITPIPFNEDNLWNGYPEDTNAPYGLAKKMLLTMAQSYRKQYGMNVIYLLPVNLYGEGDNFDLQSSHVIPALIRKFVDAKEEGSDYVTIWGTGTPTREFLYVEDAAEGIYLATKNYDKSDPVNLGSGMEISIKDLSEKIKGIVGFKGGIIYDKSKPDGQPRRVLNINRAIKEFGFKAKTSFDEGLKKTIDWYVKNIGQIKYYENYRNSTNVQRFGIK